MTYKSYEARIQRIAAVTKGLRKWAPLIASVLLIAVLATGGFLFAKGMVIGGVTCPPVIEYGDSANPTSFVVMGSAVYEYAVEGGTEWSQTPPTLPGKYQVRAVTTRSFGLVSHSDPTPFIIQPRKVTVTVTEDSIPYGDTPTISVELMNGDRVESVSLEFQNLEISPNTPVHISKETIRIVNANGEDVTSAYELNTVDKIVAVVPRPITLSTESAEKVYDGTPLSAPQWTLKEGSLMEGDTLEVVVDRSATYVTEGAVENSATTLAVKNAKGGDVTHFYKVTTEWGTLSIKPVALSVRTESVSWEFGSKTDVGKVQLIGPELPAGHTKEETPLDIPVAPGQYTNLWKLTVLDGAGKDVSANFVVNEGRDDHENWGLITIYPRQLTVTTPSASKEYDGTPLSMVPTDGKIENMFEIEDYMAISKYQHQVIVDESTVTYLTGCGTVKNVFAIRIYDEDGVDVTETHYDILYDDDDYGTLTVTPKQLRTVETFSAALPYNYNAQSYTEHVIENFYMQNQDFPDGHTVEIIPESVTSITNVTDGPVENKCEILIRNAVGDDVTDCFTFEYHYGELSVVPLDITIAPKDESGFFGDILRADTPVDVNGVLPEGYLITADFNGELGPDDGVVENGGGSAVSEVSNVKIYKGMVDPENEITANFNIIPQTGTLTVTKRPITIAPSDKKPGESEEAHSEPIEPMNFLKKSGVTTFSSGAEDEVIWKYYDGTPLKPDEIDVVEMDGCLQLPDGFVIEATFNGAEVTLVGEGVVSSIVNFAIYKKDEYGNVDKGKNYNNCFLVTPLTRRLEVRKRSITLETPDAVFSYNGNAQSMTVEDLHQYLKNSDFGTMLEGLADPHTFEIVSEPKSITFVKEENLTNDVTVQIYNSKNENVTDCFDITTEFGKLSITPVDLTIIPQSVTKIYDGRPLNGASRYTVIGALPGHKLVVPEDPTGELFASITDVDEAQSRFPQHDENGYRYQVIYNGIDVVDNFNIIVANDHENAGQLTILPRKVPLNISSLEVEYYDGQEHYLVAYVPSNAAKNQKMVEYEETVNGVTYLVRHELVHTKVLRDATQATYKASDYRVVSRWYVITDGVVGDTPVKERDVTPNYELTGDAGTLTITPAPVNLILESYNDSYDGREHTVGANLAKLDSLYSYEIVEDGQTYRIIPQLEGGISATLVLRDEDGNVQPYLNTCDKYSIVGYKYKIIDGVRSETPEGTMDLTANYAMSGENGTLLIQPVRITIAPQDSSKIYDGMALTSNTVLILKGEMVPGEWIEITTNGRPVNVDDPTVNAIIGYTARNQNREDVTDCYEVTCEAGTLTILPREMSIVTGSGSRPFDGTPLSAATWTLLSGSLADGQSLGITDFASITYVGTTDNTCRYTVWGASGDDVTRNYNITVQEGTLEITVLQILVTTQSDSKVYDGTPLYGLLDHVTVSGLPTTLTASVDGFTSITEVGDVENGCSVTLRFAGSEVDTDQYAVSYVFGMLTVVPREITVTTPDASKEYDGTPLITDANQVTVDNLLPGHRLVLTPETSRVFVGSELNKWSVTIYDAQNKNVTGFYNVNWNYGTLTINPRTVLVKTPSYSKVYDGVALVADPAEIQVLNMASGHIYFLTGGNASQTGFGTMPNSCEITEVFNELNEPVSLENFNIIYQFGVIDVKRLVITVTTPSASKVYDGKPLNTPLDAIVVEGLPEGFVIDFLNAPVIIKPGHCDNDYDVVIKLNEYDVSNCFDVLKEVGKLEVTPFTVTVATPSDSKVFDGTPLFSAAAEYDLEGLPEGFTALISGDVFVLRPAIVRNVRTVQILDPNDEVVTDLCNIVFDFGNLEVTKCKLTVITPSITKEYDGTPLENDPSGVIAEGLVNGEFIPGSGTSITEPGSTINKLDNWHVIIDGEDFTDCFDYEFVEGTLTVIPVPPSSPSIPDMPFHLVVAPMKITKTYDGQLQGPTGDQFFIVEGYWNESYTITDVVFSDPQKNVGEYTITILSLVIRNEQGEDVTNTEFDVEFGTALLTILPRDLEVRSPDLSKTYDGLPLLGASGDVTAIGLAEGHRVEVTNKSSMIGIGDTPNHYTAIVLDENGLDVTDQYVLDCQFGRLTVNPIILKVKTPNISKSYDGMLLFTSQNDLVVEGLLPGHYVEVIDFAYIIEVGSVQNTVTIRVMDDSANEVSHLYNWDNINYGTLTVTKRSLNVTTSSFEKFYDGTPLVSDPSQVLVEGLLEGHTYTLTNDVSITNVGDVTNSCSIQIFDGNGNDMTDQYAVKTNYGRLTIHPRSTLKIKPVDVDVIYDGLPHGPDGYVILDDSLPVGYTIENVTFGFTYSDVGTYNTSIIDLTIRNAQGVDVTDKEFTIEYLPGYLTIHPRNLTITTFNEEKIYDGTPLISDPNYFDCDNLLSGHTFMVVDSASITTVGSVENFCTGFIIDQNGSNVTDQYEINWYFGTLTIYPRRLTITTPDKVKIYDGTPLMSTKDELVNDNLLPNHDIIVSDQVSITEPGDMQNFCTGIIVDENGYDVTDQYDITWVFGTLSVVTREPISLQIKPYEMEVTYDGLPHGPQNGSNEFWISEGTLPAGYTITNVQFTEQRTDAGSYESYVTSLTILNAQGENVTDSEFNLEFVPAKLTIRLREIDIETASLTVRFDGYDHYDFSYEILGGSLLSGHTLEVTMSTKVRNITPGQVIYNTVDSFVIRDADGNAVLTGSSGDSGMRYGIDEDGKEYVYEVFGVNGGNYQFTIRYGILKITQR